MHPVLDYHATIRSFFVIISKKHVNAKSLTKIFQVCIMASEADLIVDSGTLH